MKDKELKMQLLEQLMGAMDDKAMSRFRPKDEDEDEDEGKDMAVIEEKQVVPADKVGDVLRKKMKQAVKEDAEDAMSEDREAESEEREAMDDEEEEDYGSRLMQRIKAAKAARAMK